MAKQYIAINWNAIEDEVDKATWEKLTEQFWLDTRIPLSNDLDDWRSLSPDEQWVVGHVFGGANFTGYPAKSRWHGKLTPKHPDSTGNRGA